MTLKVPTKANARASHLLWTAGLLGVVSCAVTEEPSVVGTQVDVIPREVLDVAALEAFPVLTNGNLEILAVPGGRIELDPERKDAITALGGLCRSLDELHRTGRQHPR